MLKLSVVTPCKNAEQYLGRTLDSILSQTGDFDLEAIVVDGGSTDGTLDILRSAKDSRLRWSSESDAGQSTAINKGLQHAGGDVIGWLNADDQYQPGALGAVAAAFASHPEAQWLAGRCDIIDDVGLITRQAITHYKDRLLTRYSFRSLLRQNILSQPAVFWRREFGKSVGPLDESLHLSMDYDLWLRMAKRCDPLILDRLLASFRVHRQSKSRGGRRTQFAESYRIACRYAQGDPMSRVVHRLNVEKIVWSYHALRWLGL